MVTKEANGRKQVAVACQGGGSHTAFTAGALKRILKEQNGMYEIVGLSGTSGGAICALLIWYGLLTNDKDKAIKLLDSFWREISARSFDDMLMNEWVDRDPQFIHDMMNHGEEQVKKFLTHLN